MFKWGGDVTKTWECSFIHSFIVTHDVTFALGHAPLDGLSGEDVVHEKLRNWE